MAEQIRIDELRRRLDQDPSSIAFAQLAEALRRTGSIEEAVEICRAGLAHHPAYLSAHVTLGRALIEQGDLEAAQLELKGVLAEAPENLAAIRGLAEIHQRRGQQGEALEQYRRALSLAPHDPDLEEAVSRLAAGLGAPSSPPDAAPTDSSVAAPVAAQAPADFPVAAPVADAPVEFSLPAPFPADSPAVADAASRQLAVLEGWLDAILAERERQR